MLCKYGCGLEATHQLKNGAWCCSKSPNSCPINKKQNSLSITQAYKDGKCAGFGKLFRQNKLNCGWARGLNKNTCESINRSSNTLRQRLKNGIIKPGFLGKHHTEETKKQLSISRIEFFEKNKNQGIKWRKLKNILDEEISLQGTWEYITGEWLNKNNISFKRKPIIFKKYRRYTPDFYLPDLDLYIEVKGWWKDRDIFKMKTCLEEHPGIIIKIIDSEVIKKLKKSENISIEELKKFDELFKDYIIDFSKFKMI